MPDDLHLIEDYLPFEAISAEASREKSDRKGQISTLHLWWARRPLVVCRSAVYGPLVLADRSVRDVNVKNPPDDAKKATKVKNGRKRGTGNGVLSGNRSPQQAHAGPPSQAPNPVPPPTRYRGKAFLEGVLTIGSSVPIMVAYGTAG